MKEVREIWQSINKFYFANSLLLSLILLSILSMFSIQFKVEALQEEILKNKGEISAYEDEIQLLEVEWVYLTRPQRLRVLAAQYLQNNNYTLASQIKGEEELEKFYLTSYQKINEKTMVLAKQEKQSNQISF